MAKDHQSKAVRRSLEYIERHLGKKLTLSDISRPSRYSPPQLYRLFLSSVGTTVGDYVRRRRLAGAASELAHGSRRILDIALDCHFQSQETFSRAFKKVYGLTPGQYRHYSKTLIKGEADMGANGIKGWGVTGQYDSRHYEVAADKAEAHMGSASARIQGKKEGDPGFITLMQTFSAEAYLGQRLKLSAFVKSDQVTGWAGLWMRIDGPGQDMLRFDNMQGRAIRGTGGWQPYDVVLDVPQESKAIAFGILLSGGGTVWADNFRFEAVDLKTPTTDEAENDDLPATPSNLDFEL